MIRIQVLRESKLEHFYDPAFRMTCMRWGCSTVISHRTDSSMMRGVELRGRPTENRVVLSDRFSSSVYWEEELSDSTTRFSDSTRRPNDPPRSSTPRITEESVWKSMSVNMRLWVVDVKSVIRTRYRWIRALYLLLKSYLIFCFLL